MSREDKFFWSAIIALLLAFLFGTWAAYLDNLRLMSGAAALLAVSQGALLALYERGKFTVRNAALEGLFLAAGVISALGLIPELYNLSIVALLISASGTMLYILLFAVSRIYQSQITNSLRLSQGRKVLRKWSLEFPDGSRGPM